MRSRPALAGLSLAGVLALCASASAAPITQLTCGQVVTQSVRLAGDMFCPGPGPGLVVGAAGITIDLNGHVVDGGLPPNPPTGIVNDGYDGVTIRNGEVRGFELAVRLTGASDNRLVGLRVFGTTRGIVIEGGAGNTVKDSYAQGRSGAISVEGSDGARIVRNTLAGFFGFALNISSDNAVVASNDATFRDAGVLVAGSSNRVVLNAARFIWIVAGSGNVVARNWVFGGRGFLIDAGATNTVVRRNAATDNGDDGIQVDGASTRLIDNIANDNGDYGIQAVPGVFGSGNRASGNGNPAQCLNVVCQP